MSCFSWARLPFQVSLSFRWTVRDICARTAELDVPNKKVRLSPPASVTLLPHGGTLSIRFLFVCAWHRLRDLALHPKKNPSNYDNLESSQLIVNLVLSHV